VIVVEVWAVNGSLVPGSASDKYRNNIHKQKHVIVTWTKEQAKYRAAPGQINNIALAKSNASLKYQMTLRVLNVTTWPSYTGPWWSPWRYRSRATIR
jgi:hypothetical protein